MDIEREARQMVDEGRCVSMAEGRRLIRSVAQNHRRLVKETVGMNHTESGSVAVGAPNSMARLKSEAETAAAARGHCLGEWHDYSPYNAVASCPQCGREVQCLTRRAPNDIEIVGPAVAIECHRQDRPRRTL